MELFETAGHLGPRAQAELSQLFRRRAVEMVKDLPEPPVLFVNTHPVEVETPGLADSLEELRFSAPGVDLVLEIHESALAQTDFIVWLRGQGYHFARPGPVEDLERSGPSELEKDS